MSGKVVNANEIELNSIRYPLGGDGQIHPQLVSGFAPKQVIGDYSNDSDPSRSIWSMTDASEGIGVEEMDIARHQRRSWFSTLNAQWPGNRYLDYYVDSASLSSYPAKIRDPGFEDWTSSSVLNVDNWAFTQTAGSAVLSRESTNINTGVYAVAVSLNATGACTLVQTTLAVGAGIDNYKGKTINITIRGYRTGAGVWKATIADGGTPGSTSTAYFTDASYTAQTLTHTVADDATTLILTFTIQTGSAAVGVVYLDSISCDIPYTGTIRQFVNFNSKMYLTAGNTIYYLASAGDSMTYLKVVETTPGVDADSTFTRQSMVASVSGTTDYLFIFTGDTNHYWYMTAAEVFAQTTGAEGLLGTLGIHWNGLLFKISATGQIAYCATAATAAPDWTDNGLLSSKSFGTPIKLVTYADESGSDIIYCATTRGLFAHDYTTAKWFNTELQVPEHPDNGKGLVVQNGNLYFSAGLAVYEFTVSGNGVVVRSVGPDQDDGLPDEYRGCITDLVGGYQGDIYAILDATLISSSNKSCVLLKDAKGWQVFAVDTTANRAWGTGIVSTAYSYRLWWNAQISSTSIKAYFVTLNRARINPVKVTTAYIGTGFEVTPWFDAGWNAGNKLALLVRAFVRNMAASDTIVIKYRINHATTALESTWTTLGTFAYASNGTEQTYGFGSSAGITFKAIQFRLEFTGTSPYSSTPDLCYVILEYEKVVPSKWGWSFVVDCTKEYNGVPGPTLLDNLVTATELQTLATFVFRATTKYVRVQSVSGVRQSGEVVRGQYNVSVVEK